MEGLSYLQWLVKHTPTKWWHDSGDPDEFAFGILQGATGVTTNPVLTSQALKAKSAYWSSHLESFDELDHPEEKIEALMRSVARPLAHRLQSVYLDSQGAQGYVCAQVNPAEAGNREVMLDMARKFHSWAPNIAVKLPVTAAGLDVLEECIADGITITATVSFTVPQVIAIAERHRKGIMRAKRKGIKPGHCFAVIMIGRIDDYLRDVALDNHANVTEADIRCAGLAVSKRAYSIFKKANYEAVLLVAALRGNYHMTELAGAELIMSIHPKYQAMLLEPGVPRENRIDKPLSTAAIHRLQTLPEFIKAYEPDGMQPDDFITYGVTQKTLAQFYHDGWAQLAHYQIAG